MPITFPCPSCNRVFENIRDEYAGRTSNCPTCRNPVTVPTPGPAIEIILDGTKKTITKKELFDLAEQEVINPQTSISVNGTLMAAGDFPDIVFGQSTDDDDPSHASPKMTRNEVILWTAFGISCFVILLGVLITWTAWPVFLLIGLPAAMVALKLAANAQYKRTGEDILGLQDMSTDKKLWIALGTACFVIVVGGWQWLASSWMHPGVREGVLNYVPVWPLIGLLAAIIILLVILRRTDEKLFWAVLTAVGAFLLAVLVWLWWGRKTAQNSDARTGGGGRTRGSGKAKNDDIDDTAEDDVKTGGNLLLRRCAVVGTALACGGIAGFDREGYFLSLITPFIETARSFVQGLF